MPPLVPQEHSGSCSSAGADGPRITIALPTFRRPATTAVALASALAQSYPAHEIIVSDDTPDDSVERVVAAAGDDRVRYVANRPALGIPDKFNDLLQRATGDWMVFLGDDDAFAPELLATVADAIRAHPAATLVHTRVRMVDSQGKLLAEDQVPQAVLSPAALLVELFQYWYRFRVTITGFFFPVELMRRIGGFHPSFEGYFCDTLGWTELALHGPTCLISQPLVSLTESPKPEGPNDPARGEALLASRADIACRLVRALEAAVQRTPREGERRALRAAGDHALRFLGADTRQAARDVLGHLALQRGGRGPGERFDAIVAMLRQTRQPHVCTLGLKTYLWAIERVARLPLSWRPAAASALKLPSGVTARIRRGGRPAGPGL